MSIELISTVAAADVLRKLADELVANDKKFRVTVLEHRDWSSIGEYQLVVKWARR